MQKQEVNMKFDHRVFSFWREQKRLKLEDVGKAVGVTKQTVSKWEKGLVIPRKGKIKAIAELFGISVYDISDLPPEPEILNRSAQLEAALKDPMFELVLRSWDVLTAASKGELIEFIQKKLEEQKHKKNT